MSFKENLLKKIQINQLSRRVRASFGTPQSGSRIDIDAMRSLLEMGPFQYQKERDLDLYIEDLEGTKSKILVLDNELPIYLTTVEDVVIRKSPYTKEMLNIGNMIKILKDSDVKISRKEASLETVQKECIDRLDLTYNAVDIEAIAGEGSESLENGYSDGVLESLTLFAELLGYLPPPRAFRIRHHEIFGAVTAGQGSETLYGPAVILSLINNSLVMINDKISSIDKEKIEYFQLVVQGKEKPAVKGAEVFKYLANEILKL